MNNWCPKCKGFMYSHGVHKCPPLWKTNVPTYEEDEWVDVFAQNARTAAERRAGKIDAGDYNLMDGDTMTVRVQTEDGIEEYEVSGEAIPQYLATKINPALKENDG